MDKLDSLLKHSSPRTRVFHAGPLLAALPTAQMRSEDAGDVGAAHGQLFLLQSGHVSIQRDNGGTLELAQPALVLFPRPQQGLLIPQDLAFAPPLLVAAQVDFGAAMRATLALSIPDVLVIFLNEVNRLTPMLTLMFGEAAGENCGRKVALNHLMNYTLVLLLRQLMEAGEVSSGVLAALADKRLSIAMTAMHDRPDLEWTLESLAEQAGMSRARFASHFRAVTLTTPLEYLTGWRIELVKNQLRQGRSLKTIAPRVGYGSAEALIRSFARRTNQTPREWLRERAAG